MAFQNRQLVQAADLNTFSVTSVTTTGDVIVGDDLTVTDDASIGGDLAVTGSLSVGGVPVSSTVTRDIMCGRLSLTSGTAMTTSDVTAATTLYYVPYLGNQVSLYSGTEWVLLAIAQLSIAVPATTAQMYDVFLNYNAGTPALALTAWTNDTTRATALTTQDGVLVKSGSTTQRYIGSFRTTAVSGETEDSEANRFLWNLYHQRPLPMRAVEATDSWNYTIATWRQARASTSNQLNFVVGVAGHALNATAIGIVRSSAGPVEVNIGIGIDSTTAPTAGQVGRGIYANASQNLQVMTSLRAFPAVGYHYAAWLEYSEATAVTTWFGDNGDNTRWQSGIFGVMHG